MAPRLLMSLSTMKKIMMSFLFVHGAAHASVNLQTGSWNWSLPLDGISVDYNSRSLHHGRWGQGWCSDLDVQLKKITQSSWSLMKCGQKVDGVFKENREGVEARTKDEVFYFNAKDLLLKKWISKGLPHRVLWSEGKISEIQSDALIFRLSTDQDGRVLEWKSPFEAWKFSYREGALSQALRERSLTKGVFRQSFLYDALSNLLEISWTDTTARAKKIMISYDGEDRVSQVRAPDSCDFYYSFDETKESRELFLLSTVKRKCPFTAGLENLKSVRARFEIQKERELVLTQVEEVTL